MERIEPLITIIIPVYNTEGYVKDCLESIRRQTYQHLEILVINDGSTDNSINICREYEKKDSRFTVINQVNQGVSAARNNGIEKAKGEFIVFVDSDDILHEKFCELMINTLINENADVSVCRLKHVAQEYKIGQEQKYLLDDYSIEILENIEKCFSSLKDGDDNYFSIPANKMYTRKIIGKTRFNKKITIGEDLLFNTLIFNKSKKVCFIMENLYFYRGRNNSAFHAPSKEGAYSAIAAFEEVILRIDKKVTDYTIDRLKKELFEWCLYVVKNNHQHKELGDGYFQKYQSLYRYLIKSTNIRIREKIKMVARNLLLKVTT